MRLLFALLSVAVCLLAAEFDSARSILAHVPQKDRAKAAPIEDSDETRLAGQKLFEQHCAECHGESDGGTRRGPSLRDPALQQAKDGEIFWVLTNGVIRRGMPPWDKLPEPQRWQVVNFVKSLH